MLKEKSNYYNVISGAEAIKVEVMKNCHPGLHFGQFDFYLNTSSSLAFIKPWVFFNLFP